MNDNSIPAYWTDLTVLAVLLVSGGLAFFRGFIREVLSLCCWIGSILITAALIVPVREAFVPAIKRSLEAHGFSDKMAPFLASAVGGGLLFVVILSILSLISHFIVRKTENSPLEAVNRSLGFLFGLFRGALLVCLGFLILKWLYPIRETQPSWMRNAKTYGIMDMGAGIIQAVLPNNIVPPIPEAGPETKGKPAKPGKGKASGAADAEPMLPAENDGTVPTPPPVQSKGADTPDLNGVEPKSAPAKSDSADGYGSRDRQELQRIIDNTNPPGEHPNTNLNPSPGKAANRNAAIQDPESQPPAQDPTVPPSLPQ